MIMVMKIAFGSIYHANGIGEISAKWPNFSVIRFRKYWNFPRYVQLISMVLYGKLLGRRVSGNSIGVLFG